MSESLLKHSEGKPKKPESENGEQSEVQFSKEILAMYQISGQPSITKKSFDRFWRDEANFREAIKTVKPLEVLKVPTVNQQMRDIILYAPRVKRARLIRGAINSKKVEDLSQAVLTIKSAPEEEQAGLRKLVADKIRKMMASENLETQVQAVGMIWSAPEEEQADLRKLVADKVREIMASENFEAQVQVVEMIWSVLEPEKTSLRKLVADKIREIMASENFEAQVQVAKMIKYAPENEQSALIREIMAGENLEAQAQTTKMITYVPYEEEAGLFEIIKKMPPAVQQAFIASPLYWNKEINADQFSRTPFEKSGSETTLVGGNLKEKAIIRHLIPETFDIWKKLYMDYEMWKKEGFDYVPIEPIISFKMNKNGLVDVFSGVLDLSLGECSEIPSLYSFMEELLQDREKIIRILNKLNIRHGHTHDGNFCLRFFRNQDGSIDFDKKPRIYLIDFDEAVSP